ncbi:hypothetical protein Ciccas_002589 [Cichlidogyrus casuarinus]|uniref:Ras-GEF domain-containing protein n=1 Tax=Cichlidogyrus casuarinus TaxID=1844966 RepID=A0ABD2QH69_9PLAT
MEKESSPFKSPLSLQYIQEFYNTVIETRLTPTYAAECIASETCAILTLEWRSINSNPTLSHLEIAGNTMSLKHGDELLSKFVQATIQLTRDINLRAKLLDFWLQIAGILRTQLKDFWSYHSIIWGLFSQPILQMKALWTHSHSTVSDFFLILKQAHTDYSNYLRYINTNEIPVSAVMSSFQTSIPNLNILARIDPTKDSFQKFLPENNIWWVERLSKSLKISHSYPVASRFLKMVPIMDFLLGSDAVQFYRENSWQHDSLNAHKMGEKFHQHVTAMESLLLSS